MKTMLMALVACAVVALPAQATPPGPVDHPAHAADAPMTEKEATFALFKAVNIGTAEEVKASLDAGASVNGYAWKGATVLHYAADRNTGEVVGLLLDAGADPIAPDVNGRLPMDYAGNNARFVGTDAYQRLSDATAWGRCLEQMGDRDACSVLRGLSGISEELSAIQEGQQEAEACVVEHWRWSYEAMLNALIINGTATCNTGDVSLQVFDERGEFLGATLAGVVRGIFSVMLDARRKPSDVTIKFN